MSHSFAQPKSHTSSYRPSARRRSAPARNGLTPRSRAAFDISRIPITPTVQTKLTISEPGDKHEREADQVADRIMTMPEQKVQRMCAGCDEEQGQQVQRQTEPEEEEEETAAPELIQREAEPEDDEDEEVAPKLIQRQAEEKEDEEENVAPKLIQRQAEPEEDEEETISPKAQPGRQPQASAEIAHKIRTMRGGGAPLPDPTRAFFEPRFGREPQRLFLIEEFLAQLRIVLL